jgi:GTPase SAR1 family protein
MEKNKTSENLGQKMRYDYLVKIKMVGDSNAGKSSIVMRFCEDQFTDHTMPTIGTHSIF